MSGARRIVIVAALVAVAIVPLRAFGVVGPAAPGGLAVSASLGSCGVAGDGILCRIDASFGGVEGADYYTASVTRADGSVQDAGTVGNGEGGGSASIYVPYVGAGVYSVTISAWGSPEDDVEAEPELLQRDSAEARRDDDSGRVSAKPAPERTDAAGDEAAPAEPPAADADPAAPEAQTLPECEPEAAAEPAAAPAEEPAADDQPADPASRTDLLTAPVADEPATEQPAAPPVECTEPSADAGGPCCPPAG